MQTNPARAPLADRDTWRPPALAGTRLVDPATLAGMGQAGALLLPLGLLLAGAAVGLAFTLDQRVAGERLLGLALAGGLALLALGGLRRIADVRVAPLLVGVAAVALLSGLWVIAAASETAYVFRGTVGDPLTRLFAPLSGLVRLADPVEITNTRFIVGYNGLADLCLVAIFAGGAALLARPSRPVATAAGAVGGVGLLMLVGTSSRGALAGLLAGLWVVGLLVWRRGWLLAILSTPLVLALAASRVVVSGLDTSSTAGRLAFWSDWARLLAEYPLTGVGLGLDTAYRVVVAYQVNPDPERIAYAHNTFVQTYLEMGPLGSLGMVIVPPLALAAAWMARRASLSPARIGLLAGGLGLMVGLETHGVTDQVITTDVGTLLLLLSLAAILAAAGAAASARLAAWSARVALGVAVVAVVLAVGLAAVPGGRALALLNLGGLELNQALYAGPQVDRARLTTAEATLDSALAQDPGHPAILRELALARAQRYDIAGAMDAVGKAAASPRIDAFDELQIARVYLALGFGDEAYAWAARAYQTWGRTPPTAVIGGYERATLPDDSRGVLGPLVDQGEAAVHARDFATALDRFQQAYRLAPHSAYLADRVAYAQRKLEQP